MATFISQTEVMVGCWGRERSMFNNYWLFSEHI